MTEEIKHYQIGTKYRAVIERSATKGILGYKVETNGDNLEVVLAEVADMKNGIEETVGITEQEIK